MARDNAQAASPSPEAKCGRCGSELTPNLYCVDCGAWPLNVTPIRRCDCGSRIDLAGLCMNCHSIKATRLVHTPTGFKDSGCKDRLLPREENARRMSLLRRIMGGEMTKAEVVSFMRGMERTEPGIGWDEGAEQLEAHVVGYHEDYLPAGIRHTAVQVGTTRSGARIMGALSTPRIKPAPAPLWEPRVLTEKAIEARKALGIEVGV